MVKSWTSDGLLDSQWLKQQQDLNTERPRLWRAFKQQQQSDNNVKTQSTKTNWMDDNNKQNSQVTNSTCSYDFLRSEWVIAGFSECMDFVVVEASSKYVE